MIGDVLHATYGYDCTRNLFCVVIRETPKTVMLVELTTSWIEDSLRHFNGIPVQDSSCPLSQKTLRQWIRNGPLEQPRTTTEHSGQKR